IPNAMFAAMPPRRTSRSSTRKDSEILSSWSTTKESVKRPSKVIRWSVAIDPVTAMRTGALRLSDGRTATWEDYRPVGVPHARAACDARVVTAMGTPATGPAKAEAGSLDELVADAAE